MGNIVNFERVTMPATVILNNSQLLADHIARELEGAAAAASRAGTFFHVSLAGGSTPKKLFSTLAGAFARRIAWKSLHFWWGDERCVPLNDPESNFGIVQEVLFSKVKVPSQNIHSINGEADPQKESIRYREELK